MIENHIKLFAEWAKQTFTEATPISSLIKLNDEVIEVLSCLSKNEFQNLPEEYADCMMCIIDSANRAGITPDKLFAAFRDKLYKNTSRVWVKNADNTYSHLKENN